MDKTAPNAHNVVSMTDYQPETGFAAIAQVEAYWEALRGAKLLPQRAQIDPRGIELALENAFILERIAPGIARLRVAGSHLNDLMGMEVRGMPLTSFFVPAARRMVADALEEVFQAPAVCNLRLNSAGGMGRATLNARMVLMPLKSDLGDVSRALGCLVAQGDIGLAPRRFDIQAQDFRNILPGQPDRSAPEQNKRPSPGLEQLTAEAAPGFEAPQTPFEGKTGKTPPPYLRLVKSDEDGGES